MKKTWYSAFFILSSMLISANFFSCKNNTTETKLVYTENNTIKQAVKNKEQEITWTIEIAPERLQQDFSRASANISPEILFNVDLIKVRSNDKAPVFPELDDFGSLDLSKLKPEAKERIIKVCEALSKSLYSARSQRCPSHRESFRCGGKRLHACRSSS